MFNIIFENDFLAWTYAILTTTINLNFISLLKKKSRLFWLATVAKMTFIFPVIKHLILIELIVAYFTINPVAILAVDGINYKI